MAATPRRPRLVLDANFLFDLADEQDFTHDLRDHLEGRGFALFVVPTVVQEIALIASNIREKPAKRILAETALRKMLEWKITPYNLIPVGHGITEQFAQCLMNKGLLPVDKRNDGLILAETALEEIPGLVTSDNHLLSIPDAELQAVLKEKDLFPPLTYITPRTFCGFWSGCRCV